jgi:hypothetical protein
MKEKEDDKIGQEEENNIITSSDKHKDISEQDKIILDSKDIYKTFECEIIEGNKLKNVNLVINIQNMTIQIKLFINDKNDKNNEKKINDEDDFILLKNIEQIDFISFRSQEKIDNDKINQIKNNILIKSTDKNNTEDKLLSQKEICALTYFPNISKSNCNFCKCIFCCDCKCRKHYRIREYITEYLIIQNDSVEQIKKCIYEISLPKINELQAKNRKRKFLAFINPIGGKGNALSLWDKAEKIFSKAEIQIDKIL